MALQQRSALGASAVAAALLIGAASSATVPTLRKQWLASAERRAAREPPRAQLARSDLPDPWCHGNGTCGLPNWPAQWNLTESTIMYFMDTGGFDPPMDANYLWNRSGVKQPWGLISVDHGASEHVWAADGWCNEYPDEAVMVQNCERIKHEWAHEGGGAKRCFIYRSGSAPLQWQESAREVTNVPNRWYMLMQWATSPAPSLLGNGTPTRDPNGFLPICTWCWRYNMSWMPPEDMPGAQCELDMHSPQPGVDFCPGHQWSWNFTVPDTRDYWVSSTLELIQNAGGLVDGLFSDEDNYMHQDWRWNQSDDQMALHQYQERFTYQTMLDTLIDNGYWFWSAFNGEHHNDVVPGNNNNSGWGGEYFDAAYCSNWMRARCNTEWTATHVMAVQLDVPNINESIASFLVVRGPVAYIGFGAGYHPQTWREEFFMDVGEPTGNCTETSPGVFERNWTYGLASMNCNTYKAGPIPQNPARNNSW